MFVEILHSLTLYITIECWLIENNIIRLFKLKDLIVFSVEPEAFCEIVALVSNYSFLL